MRIAINGRLLIRNKLEGIGYFTYEVIKNLVTHYPENDYLILFDQQPDKKFLIPGIEYKVIPLPARRPFLYTLWFEVLIPFYLRNWDAELFLSFDGFCSLRSKVPTLLCVHDLAYIHYPDYIPKRELNFYQKYQKKFALRADSLITVSDFSRNDISRQYNIPSDKIEVVYNGSRFENTAISSDSEPLGFQLVKGKYFLYTGSLHPRKNIVQLINAFDQYKDSTGSDYKLVLVGRVAWKSEAILLSARESKYTDEIIFTGYLDDHTVWRILSNASALCYISKWEGFGVPILDAMHAGIPIISAHSSSLPEVGGNAVIYIDPFSSDDIAKAMESIVTNENLKRRLLNEALVQRKKFSWVKTSEVIYRNCVEIFKNFKRI
ncbi:glycosyltransferase family 4 protein [Membranihabitans maritimus]|uniref:glycosyltransferase family 4 protein n=1 Tax=Membranihabitans maritimus TaxID=2904244 RepID=UPI001F1BC4BB|nr:glycosyltransferase family 1 protein [Membranihabitans maritimus]